MVKKIIILAIIGMIFLTGCERINDDGGGSEMTPDVNFDWNNTVRVLQMALGGTQEAAEDSAHILSEREIRGAVSAKLLEDRFQERAIWHGGSRILYTIVIMEIVTEDGKVFELRFGDSRGGHRPGEDRWWVISDIRDMQTGIEWSSWENEGSQEIEPEPDPDFDLDRAVRVVQEAVGSDDETVNRDIRNSVRRIFVRVDIKGAVNAEIIENSDLPMLFPDSIVVKIETEDGVHYYLHLRQGRNVERIWDYESREEIWPPPRR